MSSKRYSAENAARMYVDARTRSEELDSQRKRLFRHRAHMCHAKVDVKMDQLRGETENYEWNGCGKCPACLECDRVYAEWRKSLYFKAGAYKRLKATLARSKA